MANDTESDFSGILGKLGAGPGGGLFGGKIAEQPLYPQPQQPAGAPAVGPDMADLQRVLRTIQDNATTLMAMGGGMMTGGIGHGLEAGAKMADADRKHHTDTASRETALRALLIAGVPLPIAQAAASNPTILKSVAGHAFSQTQPAAPQPPQTIKARLADGGDAVMKWDPASQQFVQVVEAPAQ